MEKTSKIVLTLAALSMFVSGCSVIEAFSKKEPVTTTEIRKDIKDSCDLKDAFEAATFDVKKAIDILCRKNSEALNASTLTVDDRRQVLASCVTLKNNFTDEEYFGSQVIVDECEKKN